jgi:hypothetical protein
MSLLRRFMSCLVAVIISSQYVHAITIKNTTLNTTIFSDDFENDTVGMVPDSPSVGTWFFANNTILTVGALVRDDVSPGPKQGAKYLEIRRAVDATQDSGRAEVTFTPLADGETLSATFSFQYVSTGTSSGGFGLYTGASNNNARVNIFTEPDFNEPNFYSLRGTAFDNRVDTPFPVTTGQWQTIGIEYTQGSADLKLTVDGMSQILTDAVLVDGAIDRIRFGTGNSGTNYFLDAIPPAALPGDYNSDGAVNAADYVVWRHDPANHGGTPDGYNVWRSKFGEGSGAGNGLVGGTAVPEPSALALLTVIASLCLGVYDGRRRQKGHRQ